MLPRLRTAVIVGLAATVGGCGSRVSEPAAAPVHLRWVTGPVGGGFHAFGEALIEVLAKTSPGIVIARQASGGVVSNLEAIQRDEADVGFAFGDVAYLAANGQLASTVPVFDRLRAIAVVQLTPVQLVAAPRTAIRSVRDLRGLRVALGPEGSGTAMTARLILGAFGIASSGIRAESLEFDEAGSRLIDGRLDAMFDNATYAESIALALGAGARLIPVEGREIVRLRQSYPFLRVMALRDQTYPGVQTVATVGVDSILVCSSDLDERVVHELTAGLFSGLAALSRSSRWNLVDFADAPATPIPLHDGAARYYREQELVR